MTEKPHQIHIKEYIGVNNYGGLYGVGTQGYSDFEVWRLSTENHGGWFEPWEKVFELGGIDIDFPAVVKDRESLWEAIMLAINIRWPNADITYEKRHILMLPKDVRIGKPKSVTADGVLEEFKRHLQADRHGVMKYKDIDDAPDHHS